MLTWPAEITKRKESPPTAKTGARSFRAGFE